MSSQSLWTSQDSRGDVTHALRTVYVGLAQHLSKFDLQTLHVYKYMEKSIRHTSVYYVTSSCKIQIHIFSGATFHTSLAPLVRSHRIELDKSSNATGLPKAMVKMGGARPLETLGSRISENSGNPAWGVYIMLHWYILTCHQITIKSPGVNLGPGMIRDSPRCVNK